jgi:hypothetical protein
VEKSQRYCTEANHFALRSTTAENCPADCGGTEVMSLKLLENSCIGGIKKVEQALVLRLVCKEQSLTEVMHAAKSLTSGVWRRAILPLKKLII